MWVFQYVNNCLKEDSHHLFSMASVRGTKIKVICSKEILSYALVIRFSLDAEPVHWQIRKQVRPSPYWEEVAKPDPGSWEGMKQGAAGDSFHILHLDEFMKVDFEGEMLWLGKYIAVLSNWQLQSLWCHFNSKKLCLLCGSCTLIW